MAKELKLNLPPPGDLFSTQEERDDAKLERVLDLPLSEISDFPDHPFKVRMDAEMQEMSESIRKYGVLVPTLVRPKENGGYEMVAGHRRKTASELAGRETIPVIVRNLTDDEATIIMVDSNLQREKILPSEKAFAYKMRLEAMNRLAGRPKQNNLTPVVSDSKEPRTNEKLAKVVGESREQIRRYIRLTELTPELLQMMDNAILGEKPQIAMRPAVELSYLPKEHQQALCETIESEDCTPSHVQAMKMRKFADEGCLDENVIRSIMQEEKPNQVEQFKLPKEKISRFFSPGTPAQKIESDIVKGLELLRQRERQRNDSR